MIAHLKAMHKDIDKARALREEGKGGKKGQGGGRGGKGGGG